MLADVCTRVCKCLHVSVCGKRLEQITYFGTGVSLCGSLALSLLSLYTDTLSISLFLFVSLSYMSFIYMHMHTRTHMKDTHQHMPFCNACSFHLHSVMAAPFMCLHIFVQL